MGKKKKKKQHLPQPTLLFSVGENVPESMVTDLLESGALLNEIRKYALAHNGKIAERYKVHMQMIETGLHVQLYGEGKCIGTIDELTTVKQDLTFAGKSASNELQ